MEEEKVPMWKTAEGKKQWQLPVALASVVSSLP